MRKSTAIATCLVDAGFRKEFSGAQKAIKAIFDRYFPKKIVSAWDTDIEDKRAERVISESRRSSTIHVKRLIETLSE